MAKLVSAKISENPFSHQIPTKSLLSQFSNICLTCLKWRRLYFDVKRVFDENRQLMKGRKIGALLLATKELA